MTHPASIGPEHGNGHASEPSTHLADHLDLEGALAAPVVAIALDEAAAALGGDPSSVVDLGAGTGVGSVALATRFPGARVRSLDISRDLLDRLAGAALAAGVADRIEVLLADLDGDWPSILAGPVDLVWAGLSLHHVSDPVQVLRQARATLRPGGVLVVTEMMGTLRYEPADLGSGRDGLQDRLVGALSERGYPRTADWTGALSTAGFEVVRRVDATVRASADSTEGTRYLSTQLRSCRELLADELAAEDIAGLDLALDMLAARQSGITLSSGRAVWVAVRPADIVPGGPDEVLASAPGVAAGTVAARPVDVPERLSTEVVVVGGGSAGLAAAITLARSRRDVVVVDAGEPRNGPADGIHNVLGNEGLSPQELLARGRREAEGYGVRIVAGRVTGATGSLDAFTIEVDDGVRTVRARRVILTTGLVDDLPDIPGVREAWGRTVLHCPFCHGWEIRDQRIAILSRDEVAIHQAMLFRQLSDTVTLLLHEAADPTSEQREQLAALGVQVVRPRVERLVVEGRQVHAVQLASGETLEMDAVVVVPRFHARIELYEALGGAATETPFGRRIATDQRGATAVPGVWAAGNASEPMAMVVASAAAGVLAGASVHGDLAVSDLTRAVQARGVPE